RAPQQNRHGDHPDECEQPDHDNLLHSTIRILEAMSERDETSTAAPDAPRATPGARLARNMVFYTVMRLLLVVAIALLIVGLGLLVGVEVPMLVAAIIAVLIAMPLSMGLFTRMRAAINADIADLEAGRREKREDRHPRMDEAGGPADGPTLDRRAAPRPTD